MGGEGEQGRGARAGSKDGDGDTPAFRAAASLLCARLAAVVAASRRVCLALSCVHSAGRPVS